MQDIERTTLVGKIGKFVGFGHDNHPEKSGWFVQVTFYLIESKTWVICISEIQNKPNLKVLLNYNIPGSEFAPFAQRSIQGIDYNTFKKLMEDSLPAFKLEWAP